MNSAQKDLSDDIKFRVIGRNFEISKIFVFGYLDSADYPKKCDGIIFTWEEIICNGRFESRGAWTEGFW